MSNPIAAVISLPCQLNFDREVATRRDGKLTTPNIRLLVPMRLNDDWNAISRTTVRSSGPSYVNWQLRLELKL